MAGGSADQGRSVVGKVAVMLAAFADGSAHSVQDFARRAGLSRSTAYRLASELVGRGVLQRAEDGSYRVGPALRAAVGPATPALSSRAPAVMADLGEATGARVLLGLTVDSGAVVVHRLADSRPEPALSAPETVPAHATAVGKVLLAFGPEERLDRVIAGGLERYTPHTITGPDRLRAELAEVRRTGMAFARRELRLDLCAAALPVVGPDGLVCAALAVLTDDSDRDLPLQLPALSVAASCLSRELEGGRVPEGRLDRVRDGRSGALEPPGSDRRSRPWYGLRINRAGTVSYRRRKIWLGPAGAGSIVDVVEDTGFLRVYSGSRLLREVAL